MAGGFGTYARLALGVPPTTDEPVEPGPPYAGRLFDVLVDYGDGRQINTQTYATSAEDAARQLCVVQVLGEVS